MTEYEWDIRCADMELRRLQDGFTGYDQVNFARVLLRNFGRVVQDVHIETGSLLGSIKVDVDSSGDDKWEGHISAGGSTAGVKNPVKYAVEEMRGKSLKHGGPPNHDYMRHTKDIDEEMMGPFGSFFSRGRRTPHPEGGAL